MTFQQLKYISAIAQYGSISLAARKLYVSQPRITKALHELEQEIGQTLFVRNNRGAELTPEGVKFLGQANQIIQQMQMLEYQYAGEESKQYFSVSTQHYTFAAWAFVELVRTHGRKDYVFSLLEERTERVIENVANLKSEIGILYLSESNEAVMNKIFRDRKLKFSPLFTVRPHVFISCRHPLAGQEMVRFADLEPYPCINFDQGEKIAFFFSEELCSERDFRKQIYVTDRAAVADFLIELDAYIITTGVLPSYLSKDIISKPLEAEESITVGVVQRADRLTSELGATFLEALGKVAQEVGQG